MLNPSALSTEDHDTFQIAASHIVSILYNTLYENAKKTHLSGQAASLTEGYKFSLRVFQESIRKPEFSKRILHQIHSQFQMHGYGHLTYSDCIDRIARAFIPTDYATHMERLKKKALVVSVLADTTHRMIASISRNHIGRIIDHHAEPENGILLRDEFVQELLVEKEKKYHLFIDERTGGANRANGQLIRRMQDEISKLLKEKLGLANQQAHLVEMIKRQSAEIEKLREALQEQRPQHRSEHRSVPQQHSEHRSEHQQHSERRSEHQRYLPPPSPDFAPTIPQASTQRLRPPPKLPPPPSPDFAPTIPQASTQRLRPPQSPSESQQHVSIELDQEQSPPESPKTVTIEPDPWSPAAASTAATAAAAAPNGAPDGAPDDASDGANDEADTVQLASFDLRDFMMD
jgi:hypothetical protein